MTGWRVGFGLAPAAVIGAMLKLQSHTTSNPTSIAQKAAVEALRGPQDVGRAPCWPNTGGGAISWCGACALFRA